MARAETREPVGTFLVRPQHGDHFRELEVCRSDAWTLLAARIFVGHSRCSLGASQGNLTPKMFVGKEFVVKNVGVTRRAGEQCHVGNPASPGRPLKARRC